MALNYVKGIISHFSEIESGTSQNGYDWARQTVVIDVASFNNTFSKIALVAQNDRVNDLAEYQIGDRVEIGYSVTAREWKGKWFNNVDLVNIKFLDEVAAAAPAPQAAPAAQPTPQRRVARPSSSPQIPQNTNLDPQDGDMPF